MEKITPEQAKAILNCMAIDMTGALGGLKKSNPMTDVIEQRLNAIDVAISALEKQVPKNRKRVGMSAYCNICGSILFMWCHSGYCGKCGQAIDWSE